MGRACMLQLLITLLGLGSSLAQSFCPATYNTLCNHSVTGSAYPFRSYSILPYGANLATDFAHSREGIKYLAELEGEEIRAWHAPRPGRYKFTFESEDECRVKRKDSREVLARCPEPPRISRVSAPAIANNKVQRGTVVSFTAVAENWVDFTGIAGSQPIWAWHWIEKPENDTDVKDRPLAIRQRTDGQGGNAPVSMKAEYQTTALDTPGNYTIEVQLSDGCSTTTRRICFEVECNCRPTANAMASTFWNVNQEACTALTPFQLDASRSFDFDVQDDGTPEALSFQWDLLEWEPAPDLAFKSITSTYEDGSTVRPHGPLLRLYDRKLYNPTDLANIWYRNTSRAPSATRPGYETRHAIETTTANQGYIKAKDDVAAKEKECEAECEKLTVKTAEREMSCSCGVVKICTPEIKAELAGAGKCGGDCARAPKAECRTVSGSDDLEFVCYPDKAGCCPSTPTYRFGGAPSNQCAVKDDSAATQDALATQQEALRGTCDQCRRELRDAQRLFAKQIIYEQTYEFIRLPTTPPTAPTCGNPSTRSPQYTTTKEAPVTTGPNYIPVPMEALSEDGLFHSQNRLARRDTITTSCLATNSTIKTVERRREASSINCTLPHGSGSDSIFNPNCDLDYTFCKVRLTADPASPAIARFTVEGFEHLPTAADAAREKLLSTNMRDDYKTLSDTYGYCRAFERCRGRYKFQVTVRDAFDCPNSVDFVHVTLRCNRPPVAIAGKKLTVMFQTTNGEVFPQVTLDGRSSHDLDNRGKTANTQLTYVWSFQRYPTVYDTTCQQKAACANGYCSGTNIGYGNSVIGGVAVGIQAYRRDPTTFAPELKCAPTVYPVVSGGGGATPPTQHHVGNSAYFRPTGPGNYTAQLSVFDGCSVTTDTVLVEAVCPSLTATVTLSASSSSITNCKATDFTGQCGYDSGWLPQGSNKISYSWGVVWSGLATRLIPTMQADTDRVTVGGTNTAKVSVTAKTFGTYTSRCSVSDGCQTVSAEQTHTVTCATQAPILESEIVRVTPATGDILLEANGLSYPSVTLSASASPATASISWTTRWINVVGNTPKEALATNQAGGRVSITVANEAINATLEVRAFAYDCCQQNTAYRTILLRYTCSDTHTLPPVFGSSQSMTWDFTTVPPKFTGQASLMNIDASEASWKSAGGYKRNAQSYQWKYRPRPSGQTQTVAYTPFTTTALLNDKMRFPEDLPTWSSANGILASMSIPGPGLATSAQGNVYDLQLTVTDVCTSRTSDIAVTFRCNDYPTAVLKLSSPQAAESTECDTTISNVCTVYWNSYDFEQRTSKHGRFPNILIDVSGSRNAATSQGPAYRADVRYLLGNVGTSLGQVTNTRFWQPPGIVGTTVGGSQTYNLELVTAHSPCKSAPDTKIVTTKCNKLEPSVPVSMETAWRCKRFDVTCIDMRNLQYYKDNAQRSVGNFDSIDYTWSVEQAPAGSVYDPTDTVVLKPDTRRGDCPDVRCKRVDITPAVGYFEGGTEITIRFSSYCKNQKTCTVDPWKNKLQNLPNNLRVQFVTDTTLNGVQTVRTMSAPITAIEKVTQVAPINPNITNFGAATGTSYVFKVKAPKAVKSIRDSHIRIQVVDNAQQATLNPKDVCDDASCEDAMYFPFQYSREKDQPKEQSCLTTKYIETCTTHLERTETKVNVNLINHHYNKPYTCFRPDVAGDYRIQLRMNDGCIQRTENIPVRAVCPPRIAGLDSKVKVEMQRGAALTSSSSTVNFDGKSYTRVFLDARAIQTEADQRTDQCISFMWTMEGCPSKGYPTYTTPDAIRKGDQITNERGAKASFIPREVGTYNISLTVTDECNAPQTVYIPVYVNCSIPYEPAVITISKNDLLTPGQWNPIPYRRDAPPEVRWDPLGVGGTQGTCRTTPETNDVLRARADPECTAGADCFPNYRKSIPGPDHKESVLKGVGCWGGEMFKFQAKTSSSCSITRNRWLVEDRTCAPPYTQSTPAPPPATNNCPPTVYLCHWKLMQVPCDFDWEKKTTLLPADCGDPASVNPSCSDERTIGHGPVGVANECLEKNLLSHNVAAGQEPLDRNADSTGCKFEDRPRPGFSCNAVLHFKCRFPGTYRLQFVVQDDCTTARADSVVSCQCATTPSVRATRTIYESLYLCRGDNRRFQAVNISVDVTELDGFKLARCPAPPVPTPAPVFLPSRSQCCPAATRCPECPQCPMCPQCPDAFRRTTNPGSAEGTRMAALPEILRENNRVFAESFAEESDVGYGPVIGVMLPMSAVMVLSIVGNLLLVYKIGGRRSARKSKLMDTV